MTTPIGPSFSAELAAAGLTGIAISWTQDGTMFGRDELPDDRRAALDAVLAAHDPTRPAPTVVPSEVTRAQAQIQLFRAGLLDPVKAAVTAAGGETAIWFDTAAVWRRDNEHVAALGMALGLTAEAIDGLFVAAAGIA